MDKSALIFLVFLGLIIQSCINSEPTLTPRLMKEVNKEFRKSRKDIKNEADSLCQLYREEHFQQITDSILQVRIQKDQERKIIIN